MQDVKVIMVVLLIGAFLGAVVIIKMFVFMKRLVEPNHAMIAGGNATVAGQYGFGNGIIGMIAILIAAVIFSLFWLDGSLFSFNTSPNNQISNTKTINQPLPSPTKVVYATPTPKVNTKKQVQSTSNAQRINEEENLPEWWNDVPATNTKPSKRHFKVISHDVTETPATSTLPTTSSVYLQVLSLTNYQKIKSSKKDWENKIPYTLSIEVAEVHQQTFFRLLIGPFDNRQEAEAMEAAYGLDGTINNNVTNLIQ